MDHRERAVLVEVGRYYRVRIARDYGPTDFSTLRRLVREGIETAAAVFNMRAAKNDLDVITLEVSNEPETPSALAGVMDTLERLALARDAADQARQKLERRVFNAASLSDVVNKTDLFVTARFPVAAWEDLMKAAGVVSTGTTPAPKSLFSSVLDFSGKKPR